MSCSTSMYIKEMSLFILTVFFFYCSFTLCFIKYCTLDLFYCMPPYCAFKYQSIEIWVRHSKENSALCDVTLIYFKDVKKFSMDLTSIFGSNDIFFKVISLRVIVTHLCHCCVEA